MVDTFISICAAACRRNGDLYDIRLSTSKIRKILITGGCWTTERSREVQELFETFTTPVDSGGRGMNKDDAVKMIAEHLEISIPSVCMNLPYDRVVYDLEEKSSNAKRCDKWRGKQKR